jgi:signal peptidase I
MARGTKEKKQKSTAGSLLELALIVAGALAIALVVQAVLIKPFRIPSESMVPTLEINQRVLVDRVSYRFTDPGRGSIVVFKPPRGADSNTCGVAGFEPSEQRQACPRGTPEDSDQNFIKRVVGLPGDRLSVVDGRVIINGRPLEEPYARLDSTCAICNLPRPITIPEDQYFLMGDNRGQSADSREWGPVPKDQLIGKAFSTYWPPDRIGTL